MQKETKIKLQFWIILNTEWRTFAGQRNWVFATNSEFLITISLEPKIVDLRYFKLWILLNQIIWVWNVKGLQDRVLKLLGVNIWFCSKDSIPLSSYHDLFLWIANVIIWRVYQFAKFRSNLHSMFIIYIYYNIHGSGI